MHKIVVSVGELIDKLSILDLKRSRITDPTKVKSILNEYNSLCANGIHKKYEYLYTLLLYINGCIWDFTNVIRGLTSTDAQYSRVAADIFEYNDRRFRIKNLLNELHCSSVKEQKNYTLKSVHVSVDTLEELYANIPTFNYLVCTYDQIHVRTPHFEILKSLFGYPCIHECTDNCTLVSISTFAKCAAEISAYSFKPIVYISSGRLGDFIHQLGIVYSKYLQTGRKGMVYLRDKDWNFPITHTFEDTRDLVIAQEYICGYAIHAGDPFDIDLSEWRKIPIVFKASWYDIFKRAYSVQWCLKPYIKMTTNASEYTNRIVFHTSIERFNSRVNYDELFKKYGIPVFITCVQNEADYFLQKTGIKLETHVFASLHDFYSAIYTSKFYIGNLSSPTAFAQACFKNRVVLLADHEGINLEQTKMGKYWPNCTFLKQYS